MTAALFRKTKRRREKETKGIWEGARGLCMPFMLPGGELTSAVDVDRYLEEVPFFSLYDVGQVHE